MKRIACFAVGFILFCQPAIAQKLANKVRAIDGQIYPGDLIIPGGIGAGIYHHHRNSNARPMPMIVDPEDPEGSMKIPSEGGFFAESRDEADKKCKSRGFKRAVSRSFVSGGKYYICIK